MKKMLRDYALLLLGCMLFSAYASLFLTPAKIGTGGILGIALCLEKLFHFKIGLTTILLNIPLFLFGYKLLGKKFAFKSGIVVLISSLMIDCLITVAPNYDFVPTGDKLTSSIFCGVISGIGMSLIFMSGGSTGGLDISAKMFKNKLPSMQLSHILLTQDILVYIFVGIILGPQSVIYALIMSFIRSKTIDAVQEGISSSRQCVIICNNYEEIIEEVNNKLNRGITIINAKGGYSNNEKKFLYVVIQKHQLHILKRIVKEIDEKAFVTVSSVNDILGNYQQRSLTV